MGKIIDGLMAISLDATVMISFQTTAPLTHGFKVLHVSPDASLACVCVQIADLEVQCHEASQEKQRNVQLSVRVQELEAELHDRKQVNLHLNFAVVQFGGAGAGVVMC